MVGSAIVRQLQKNGFRNIITRTHSQLDLSNQQAVRDFFAAHKIDYVVLAAAKVGGIYANNNYPADFIYINLMIEANVIHETYKAGITKLLFLGSSCIYPKFAPQPMQEEHLLTSELEPTNEPYAIAKIAGIKLCEAYNRQYGTEFRSVMPTNLYGPFDNYHLENSHVLPALIRKFHLAKLASDKNINALRQDEEIFGPIPKYIKELIGLNTNNTFLKFQEMSKSPQVEIWGSGKAYREFLHVDDMASACFHVMGLKQDDFINAGGKRSTPTTFLNIGTGKDITIAEIVELIRELVGFDGDIYFDTSKPDGTPRKLMDTSKINALGWQPAFSLQEGLRDAYRWYCAQYK